VELKFEDQLSQFLHCFLCYCVKSSVTESEQIGITDEKENRAVDFVSQEFNQDDRWVMLHYTNEGEEYQLVVKYLRDKPRGFTFLGTTPHPQANLISPDLPRQGLAGINT
jgi:hypothetical protein